MQKEQTAPQEPISTELPEFLRIPQERRNQAWVEFRAQARSTQEAAPPPEPNGWDRLKEAQTEKRTKQRKVREARAAVPASERTKLPPTGKAALTVIRKAQRKRKKE